MGIFETLNEHMVGKTDEEKQFLKNRVDFVVEYCIDKGWPHPDELSLRQINEIREQDGWKNPKKSQYLK